MNSLFSENTFNAIDEILFLSSKDSILEKQKFIFANNNFLNFFGYKKEEIIEKEISLILKINSEKFIIQNFQNSMIAGKAHSEEIQLLKKDNQKAFLEWRISPVLGENSEIMYYLSTLKDLNSTKSARAKLAHRLRYEMGMNACSQILLSTVHEDSISEALENIILFTDISRVSVFKASSNERGDYSANPIQIVNLDLAEKNSNIRNIIFENEFHWWIEYFLKQWHICGTLDEFGEEEKEYFVSENVQSVLLIPIFTGNVFFGFIRFDDCEKKRNWNSEDIAIFKSVAFMVGAFLDRKAKEKEIRLHREHLENLVEKRTEELKKALIAANSANKAKSEFLANMSHELRSPLNSIIGFAKLIKLLETQSQEKEYLTYIHSAGIHLLKIINEILDIAKIEAGKLNLKIHPIDILDILKRCSYLLKPQLDKKEISIFLEFDTECEIYVTGDEKRVQQVFINIISNAIKFTRPKGTIRIQYRLKDSNIELDICDNGIGIAEENLEKVFENFTQIASPLNSESEGTGLGLAITKKIIEAHHGQILLKSELGKGSTFTIVLPITKKSQEPKTKISPKKILYPESIKNKNILIVDDSQPNRELLSFLFKENGQKHNCAESGEKCLEYIEQNSVDLVLMDIRMKGLSGTETLTKLKQKLDIPVIALSANFSLNSGKELLKTGFADYLPKPIDTDLLLKKIFQFLE